MIQQLEQHGRSEITDPRAHERMIEAARRHEQAAGRRLAAEARVRAAFRVGGKVLFVVAVGQDALRLYEAEDKTRESFRIVGGWSGALAAAGAFSAAFAPADGAGPVAWTAHGVGALVAGATGYYTGERIFEYGYDVVAGSN